MTKILKATSAPLGGKLAERIERDRKELDAFFGCTILDPLIVFLSKRADMDLVERKKTEKWSVATARGGVIYIFDPKVFSKVTIHDKEAAGQILKHELAHLYFTRITKSNRPVWLTEGLSCVLAGQVRKPKPEQADRLLDVFDFYAHGGKDVYTIGSFWVQLLLKRFGKRKMLALLTGIAGVSGEKEFSSIFKKIYGFPYSKDGFRKFIK